ncbi:hypothetical protein B0T10DRAFT_570355 [Thelonectria olida]|uniref:Uncharacterized protein n=1 Tax=Thelonectria olida TaxID=1576542 RepID=A0A9P8WLI7_9HYPO|nr:hypothetical protein B0T10DRAFT_570355 [Thelonectria olida]
MASTALTQGKKRSLLRSLGSRRRQKHLVESLPARKQKALAMVTPVTGEATTQPIRMRNSRHGNSIEEMASRLLDDSTCILEDQDLEDSLLQVRKNDKPVSSTSSPTEAFKSAAHLKVSPRRAPIRLGKNVISPESRHRDARVGKHSPISAVKSMRPTATTRPREDARNQRKDSGLQRPLPQSDSIDFNPLKAHPANYLKTSVSVPLGHVDGNVRHLRVDAPMAMTEPADPDEITQKLQAMLAATNALKGSATHVPNPPASKLTRMVSTSKMFAKVSHAWDRLQSKAPFESPKSRDTEEARAQIESPGELLRPIISPLHSPPAASPISTIEIRLNEGDNLNKKKVQRIVGGHVPRKPVADDGKSLRTCEPLRSGKSLDDPFSETGRGRTPTSFETRLKRESRKEDDSIHPLPYNQFEPCNPFESEKEFDNDIENRILSITPVGSSTPRIRVHRVPTPSPDDSPLAHHLMSTSLTIDSMLDGVSIKLEREELSQARLLPFASVKASDRKLVDPTARIRRFGGITAGADARGANGVKKHPSPSKEALEDLEQAFRKYACLRAAARSEEIDELATSFVSLAPPSRHKNRRASTRLSVSNIDDLFSPSSHRCHHRLRSSSHSITLSRIPRPVGSSCKLHREIRLATPFRPVDPGADDVDELQ